MQKTGHVFQRVFHNHTSYHEASNSDDDSDTHTPPARAAGDAVSSGDGVTSDDAGEADGHSLASVASAAAVEADGHSLASGASDDAGEADGHSLASVASDDADESDGQSLAAAHGAADVAVDAAGSSMEVEDHDSDTELNAPTLQLGSQSDQDMKSVVSSDSPKAVPQDASDSVHSDSEVSSESFQCSQVSSGWMGKAYNWHNRQDRKAEHDANLQKLMTDLKKDLSEYDLLADELAADYLAYAKRSVQAYGPQCYCTLASREHINSWVHQQKSSKD